MGRSINAALRACGLLFLVWTSFSDAVSSDVDVVDVVDVMVLITQEASEFLGGDEATNEHVAAAFREANWVFLNSRANIRLRPAHVGMVDYSDDKSGGETLERLCAPGDGFLDEVHTLRETYSADLICLVIGGDETAYAGMPGPAEGKAFSVIGAGLLTGDFRFPGVLSFNFGCQPQRGAETAEGAFPFSRGYRYSPASYVAFLTVEAISRNSFNPGVFRSDYRLPLFSNPRISFSDPRYDVVNQPAGGAPGSLDEADNVTTLNATAGIVSGFRGDMLRSAAPVVQWSVEPEIAIEGQPANVDFDVSCRGGESCSVQLFVNGVLHSGSDDEVGSFVLPTDAIGSHLVELVALDGLGVSTVHRIPFTVYSPNGVFEGRQVLEGDYAFADLDDRYGVRNDLVDPEWFGHGALWWSWKAPASGEVEIDSVGIPRWISSTHSQLEGIGVLVGETFDQLEFVEEGFTDHGSIVFAAEEGQTYHIFLQHTQWGTGTKGTLELWLRAYISNDLFEEPTVLSGSSHRETGRLLGTEGGQDDEPMHGEEFIRGTGWWHWTPDSDGKHSISVRRVLPNDTISGPPIYQLAVYHGDSLTDLTILTRSEGDAPEVMIDGAAGVSYRIVVGGDDEQEPYDLVIEPVRVGFEEGVSPRFFVGEPVVLHTIDLQDTSGFSPVEVELGDDVIANSDSVPETISLGELPPGKYEVGVFGMENGKRTPMSGTVWISVTAPNDDLESAFLIEADEMMIEGSTLGATLEPDLVGDYWHLEGEGGIWWTWTAPSDGFVKFEERLEGGGAQGGIYLLTGERALSRPPYDSNTRTYDVFAGERYFFSFHASRFCSQSCDLIKRWFEFTPWWNGNDDFENRIDLGSGPVFETANSGAVSQEENEPEQHDRRGGSLWWTWTASETGRYMFISNYGVWLYEGLSLADLQSAGESYQNLPDRVSVAILDVEAGEEYQIALLHSDDRSRDDVFLEILPAPANDLMVTPSRLVGERVSLATRSAGATISDGEPIPEAVDRTYRGSLWWEWIAPRDGEVYVGAISDDQYRDVDVAAYIRSPQGLEFQRVFDDAFDQTLRVEEGEVVLLQVLHEHPARFDLIVEMAAFDIVFEETEPRAGSSIQVDLVPHAGEDSLANVVLSAQGRHDWTVNPHEIPFTWTAGSAGFYRWMGTATTADGTLIRSTTSKIFVKQQNDSIATAVHKDSGTREWFSGDPYFAEDDPEAPPYGDGGSGHRLWWRWAPSEAGVVTFEKTGGEQPVSTYLVSVFRMMPDGGVLPVVTGMLDNVRFSGTSGSEYLIALDFSSQGWNSVQSSDPPGADGYPERNYWISVQGNVATPPERWEVPPTGPPVNDDFENAIEVFGDHVLIEADNRLASEETGEIVPVPGDSHGSVWWRWTSPFNGNASVRVWDELPNRSFSSWSVVSIHDGAPWNGGMELAVTPGHHRDALFPVEKGRNYFIRLRTTGETSGSSLIELNASSLRMDISKSVIRAGELVTFGVESGPAEDGATVIEIGTESGPSGPRILPAGSISASESVFEWATEFPGYYEYRAIATNGVGVVKKSLGVPFAVRPKNDLMGDAIVLEGIELIVAGNARAATFDDDEPRIDTSPEDAGGVVWWSWTALESGMLTIEDLTGFLGGNAGFAIKGIGIFPVGGGRRCFFRMARRKISARDCRRTLYDRDLLHRVVSIQCLICSLP